MQRGDEEESNSPAEDSCSSVYRTRGAIIADFRLEYIIFLPRAAARAW